MKNQSELLHDRCQKLLKAYKSGELGQTKMPEDSHPNFGVGQSELKLAYFSLPMALNYQRDSDKLWESTLKTWQDEETREVFNVQLASQVSEERLRACLAKYKVALQPNKHIATWNKIATVIAEEWGGFDGLLNATNEDYLSLKELVQKRHKKQFPYLSGPKIFNYWSYILGEFCDIKLKNREYIEIAPDTHVVRCSVLLDVITEKEAQTLPVEMIAERWRMLLSETDITPIEMHAPLWFWSMNGFLYSLA